MIRTDFPIYETIVIEDWIIKQLLFDLMVFTISNVFKNVWPYNESFFSRSTICFFITITTINQSIPQRFCFFFSCVCWNDNYMLMNWSLKDCDHRTNSRKEDRVKLYSLFMRSRSRHYTKPTNTTNENFFLKKTWNGSNLCSVWSSIGFFFVKIVVFFSLVRSFL